MDIEVNTDATPNVTLTEKELFGQFLKLRIQTWTNYGTLEQDYTPEWRLRHEGPNHSLELFSEVFTDTLENNDDPTYLLELAIEDFQDYLTSLRRVLSDFNGIKSNFFVFPDEPNKADAEAYAAWRVAANAAHNNPRYQSICNTTEEEEDDEFEELEVDYIESGSTPAPLSEPQFIDMTDKDETYIRGEA